MIADAWYMVAEYHLRLGSTGITDNLMKIEIKIGLFLLILLIGISFLPAIPRTMKNQWLFSMLSPKEKTYAVISMFLILVWLAVQIRYL